MVSVQSHYPFLKLENHQKKTFFFSFYLFWRAIKVNVYNFNIDSFYSAGFWTLLHYYLLHGYNVTGFDSLMAYRFSICALLYFLCLFHGDEYFSSLFLLHFYTFSLIFLLSYSIPLLTSLYYIKYCIASIMMLALRFRAVSQRMEMERKPKKCNQVKSSIFP